MTFRFAPYTFPAYIPALQHKLNFSLFLTT